MFEVHAVFHQFDDGEQQFRISQPAEDILEDAQVLVLHAFRDTMTEGGQHDNRGCGVVLLDVSCYIEH